MEPLVRDYNYGSQSSLRTNGFRYVFHVFPFCWSRSESRRPRFVALSQNLKTPRPPCLYPGKGFLAINNVHHLSERLWS